VILDIYHPDAIQYIYVSKNVMIRCYFSKPKRAASKEVCETVSECSIGFTLDFWLT
jgi:hypothetical protein